MPMDPLSMLRNSARRFVVLRSVELDVSMVYVIQRVGSPAFLALAMSALAIAGQQQQDEEAEAVRMLGARTDDDRNRIRAELAEEKEVRERKHQEELLKSGNLQAIIDQQDALVMAATVAVGIARNDIEIRDGLQLPETRPEDICQPLDEEHAKAPRDRTYLRPIRWAGPGQADADHLQIGHIPEAERVELARQIAAAFGPGREVTTFRERPAEGASGGEVGGDVRPAPERPDPRVSRGRGNRSGRAGGG